MTQKQLEVDAGNGLGKNLFYNSSMENYQVVCRMKKQETRKVIEKPSDLFKDQYI